MNNSTKRISLIIISILVLLIPLIFWGKNYKVGGDDTRLYYLFPREILTHYAVNIVSNNTLGTNGGYSAISFLIPILLVIIGVKTVIPFVNTQLFLYGTNLAFGFIFFFLFTGLWVEKKDNNFGVFFARVVSSIFYIFSLFVVKTVFSSELLSIYTLSVFPASLYLFIRSVKENMIFFSVLSAVIYSLFSTTLLTFPWYGAMALVSLPVLVVLAKKYFRIFAKMFLVFIVLVLGLNFYWLFHQIYPLISNSGSSTVLGSVSSPGMRADNIDLIQSLSILNNPINQLSAYIRSSWDERHNMGFAQSYGIIFYSVILFAGILVRKLKRSYICLYILTVVGLLFSFVLVTPDFGDWNIAMFTFLNNHVPLFTMFRNMYDKFGIAVSFEFAFALCISLIVLVKTIKQRYLMNLLFIVLLATTVWSANNFIFPGGSRDSNFISISSHFNDDFNNLVSYVRSMNEPSRYLWLPLNFASYVPIEDKVNPGHYYYGPSPMQFFAGVSDYTGFQSFATKTDPKLNFQMLDYLKAGNYEKIGSILQRMNVRYVIVSSYTLPSAAYAHLNIGGSIINEKPAFYQLILGDKIKDFGKRYSLYSINKKFDNNKIFLSDSFNNFPNSIKDVRFIKTYPYQYEVYIQKSSATIYLAFLEPYDRLWRLSAVDPSGKETNLFDVIHEKIFRYGNGWTINTGTIPFHGQSNEIHLRIYFSVQKFVPYINFFSITVWIVSVGYLLSHSFAVLHKNLKDNFHEKGKI